MQIYKSSAIKGTFILMAAGLLTRFLGFYYRIFLSSRIGAEGMGLYQMIYPILGLCMALSVSGIQTAISRFVSTTLTNSKNEHSHSLSALYAGGSIALPLSVITALILIFFGDAIAVHYLHEPRCGLLLKAVALSIPMGVLHSCVNGYFLGKRDAIIPGAGQLLEQITRVVSVFIIFNICADKSYTMDIVSLALIAIAGHIFGEMTSLILSVIAIIFQHKNIQFLEADSRSSKEFCDVTTISSNCSCFSSIVPLIKPIASMAFPLTMTRVILSIVHSLEASAIPFFLHKYGLSNSEALSIYGILTAMAIPFIMFPTTLTNAVAQMLLPTIASAEASKDNERIHSITLKTLSISVALGLICTTFFILTGDYLGMTVFKNQMAGDFITILAWLCPFIFASSTMGSILNGLGLTKATFYHNMISSCLCLCFVIFAVPVYGIKGYLWGLLAGELVCAVLHTIKTLSYIK